MPGPDNEPEKYSIGEIMERLQGKPEDGSKEEGELVTRADGSQAIRVRKRKRRSHQPLKQKEVRQKRLRILWVSSAVVLSVLVLLAAGVGLLFANSAPFKQRLTSYILSGTGASDLKLFQFRVNPMTANATALQLNWNTGGVFRNFEATGIAAKISPLTFFNHSRQEDEITAVTSRVVFGRPVSGDKNPEPAIPFQQLTGSFTRYGARDCSIIFGSIAQPAGVLSKSEISFYPRNLGGKIECRLTGGALTLQDWPKLKMDRSLVQVNGPEWDIVSLRLVPENSVLGHLEFSGRILPSERSSTLSVHAEDFPLASITGQPFARLISGRVDSSSEEQENQTIVTPASPTPVRFSMGFNNSPTSAIVVSGFPFFYSLARITGDSWFESPAFNKDSSGVLVREGGVISYSGLRFTAPSRMAIKGDVAMNADKTLTGSLEVGLPSNMIQNSTVARLDEIFGEPREGYRWITLRIGGTADSPTDDFQKIFTSREIKEPAAAEEDLYKPSSFEELTRPQSR